MKVSRSALSQAGYLTAGLYFMSSMIVSSREKEAPHLLAFHNGSNAELFHGAIEILK
jgi:hypothetical protein